MCLNIISEIKEKSRLKYKTIGITYKKANQINKNTKALF